MPLATIPSAHCINDCITIAPSYCLRATHGPAVKGECSSLIEQQLLSIRKARIWRQGRGWDIKERMDSNGLVQEASQRGRFVMNSRDDEAKHSIR
jgi:hypothetical protein